MDKEKLAEVAKVYLDSARLGGHPAKDVSAHFGVARSTANVWIARAKSADLLPDKMPKVNKDALAVSKAIGVSYEDLHAAIMEHAGGFIRLTNKRVESK